MTMRTMVAAAAVALCATTASATTLTYDATAFESSGQSHSLWINGLKNVSGIAQHFIFAPAGTFEVTSTGAGTTASLTGTAESVNNAGSGFEVSMSYDDDLSAYGAGPSFKGRKALQDAQTLAGDAQYLALTMGSLKGYGLLAGIDFSVTAKPTPAAGLPATQYGTAANDKNTNFGLSGWLYLIADQNNCSNSTFDLCELKPTNGDINVDLAAVPLPASALLLLGAIGGLGVAKRRKKAA